MAESTPSNNVNPPPSPPSAPPAAGSSAPPPFDNPLQGGSSQHFESDGTAWGGYKKWLGEKGFKEFQKNICDSISKQIDRDRKKQKEASDKLKKAEQGLDD